jgi:nucleoside-diphosphate-sugar epimerase
MAVVFRVYAASGRMMVEPERFALGDFLQQALKGQQLQIKARHRVERSYVHVGSLMQLAWAMLKQPKPNGFYGVDACVDRIDLLELAQAISHTFGLQAPNHTINPDLPVDRYGGNGNAFCQLLEDYRLIHPTLEQQIADTLAGLRKQTQL